MKKNILGLSLWALLMAMGGIASAQTIDEIQAYDATGAPASPYAGQIVTVEGVIIERGQYSGGSHYLLDDTGAGISVYLSPSTVALGDRVTCTGTVGAYSGEIQLGTPSFGWISGGNDYNNAEVMTVSEVLSDYENVARLVSVIGTVTSKPNASNFYFTDGVDTLQVYIDSTTGISLGAVDVGDVYQVLAPVMNYNTIIELKPRFQSDLVENPDLALHGIYVAPSGNDSLGDGSAEAPFASLQKASTAVSDGEMIIMLDGVYDGPDNQNIEFVDKLITLRSLSGYPENCIVDLDGQNGIHFQLSSSAATGGLVIQGVTFRGGGVAVLVNGDRDSDNLAGCQAFGCHFEGNGTGLQVDLAETEVSGCFFLGNTENGVLYDKGVINIIDCLFENNGVGLAGDSHSTQSVCQNSVFVRNQVGASTTTGGKNREFQKVDPYYELHFLSCRFESNHLDGFSVGGHCSGNVVMTDCQVRENDRCGGIVQDGLLFFRMIDSEITGNGSHGLQIDSNECTNVYLTNVVLADNTGLGVGVTAEAGGSYFNSYLFSQCTISGNDLGGAGGFFLNTEFADCLIVDNDGDGLRFEQDQGYFGDLEVLNCTIAGNLGWGLSSDIDLVTLTNTIVAANLGGAVDLPFEPITVLHCSNLFGNVGGDWVGNIADQLASPGNISLDPGFCNSAGGSFELSSDSPCAEANNPECGQIGALPVGCEISFPTLTITSNQGDLISCGEIPLLFFNYTPGGDITPVKGFSVRVVADGDAVAFSSTDFEVNNLPVGEEVFYQIVENGPNDFTLDYSILGTSTSGIITGESLFSITLHGVEEGVALVSMPLVIFRDLDNTTIPIDYSSQTTMTVDCTLPVVVSSAMASPGHEQVTVTWTDSPDLGLSSVHVLRGLWHDGTQQSVYPGYAQAGGNVVPAQFSTYAEYLAAPEWELVALVDPGMGSFLDVISARGIYYYQLFAIDAAGNPSAPLVEAPGATNYILGDVATPYDGEVDIIDLNQLGASYGVACGHQYYNAEVDVGPTGDGSWHGLPVPDCLVGFEDLMIFGFNYGLPALGKSEPVPCGELNITWVQKSELEWSCVLAQPCPCLKGLHLVADGSGMEEAQVERGALLFAQCGMVFLQKADSQVLDVGLVVMGAGQGIEGTGELFTVTLPAPLAAFNPSIEARSITNQIMELQLLSPVAESVPTRYALDHNYPNPFNPSTTIRYRLPEVQDVNLRVFSVDGRLVRTLVCEQQPAGSYDVVWDGRNDRNRAVASGVYFFRLEAGAFSAMEKMVLMK